MIAWRYSRFPCDSFPRTLFRPHPPIDVLRIPPRSGLTPPLHHQSTTLPRAHRTQAASSRCFRYQHAPSATPLHHGQDWYCEESAAPRQEFRRRRAEELLQSRRHVATQLLAYVPTPFLFWEIPRLVAPPPPPMVSLERDRSLRRFIYM